MSMDKTPTRIAEEAAEYFAQRIPVTTRENRADLNAWLSTDPRHASAYAEIEQLWEQLAGLRNDPDLQALRGVDLEALRTERRRWYRRTPLFAMAATVLLVLGGAYLFSRYPNPPSPVSYATSVGELRRQLLQDGSQVVLNTDTQLKTTFSRNHRDVELTQGEAQFEVAHDTKRPFVVKAGNGTVTALGTKFQVKLDESDVIVTLLEGSVEVAQGHIHQKLRPNQQARLSADNGIAIDTVDPARAEGWLVGWMRFRGTPLGDVIAEANRYSERKLRLDDPSLASVELSGNFRTGDSASIAAAAQLILPVRVDDSRQDIVLLSQ